MHQSNGMPNDCATEREMDESLMIVNRRKVEPFYTIAMDKVEMAFLTASIRNSLELILESVADGNADKDSKESAIIFAAMLQQLENPIER